MILNLKLFIEEIIKIFKFLFLRKKSIKKNNFNNCNNKYNNQNGVQNNIENNINISIKSADQEKKTFDLLLNIERAFTELILGIKKQCFGARFQQALKNVKDLLEELIYLREDYSEIGKYRSLIRNVINELRKMPEDIDSTAFPIINALCLLDENCLFRDDVSEFTNFKIIKETLLNNINKKNT